MLVRSTLGLLTLALAAAPADAQSFAVRRLDLQPDGNLSPNYCYEPVVSAGGEWVLFEGTATDLTAVPPVTTPGAINERFLYRCEVRTRTFEQVGLSSTGTPLMPFSGTFGLFSEALGTNGRRTISDDGNVIAFSTLTDDPGLGDTNGRIDVYVRDVAAGVTELVSANLSGGGSEGRSQNVSMSGDGRYVAFLASGDDMAPGLSGGSFTGSEAGRRVYLQDRVLGTRTLLSVVTGDSSTEENAIDVHVTQDGSAVYWSSVMGSILYGFSAAGPGAVKRHDIASGVTTERVFANLPRFLSVTADGSKLCYTTIEALVPEDDDINQYDVYVYDWATGTPQLASVGTLGEGGHPNIVKPWISGDGRYVSFTTAQSAIIQPGLAQAGPHGDWQLWTKDLETGLLALVSVDDFGKPGWSPNDIDKARFGAGASLSADGGTLVFTSTYDSLPHNNVGGEFSLYIHERRFGPRDLAVQGLHAGQTATIEATGQTPNGLVMVAFSTTGQGPSGSYWGPIDLAGPYQYRMAQADATGKAVFHEAIPAGAWGMELYAKALDQGTNRLSRSWFGIVR